MLPAEVTRLRDTCNVYVVRAGADAIAIDIGSGAVFDQLGELGIERITDVLVTHRHRDAVAGLQRAVDEGARIWVPPVERELFDRADEQWQARQLANDYELVDRFSLLEPVAVTGVVDEYRVRSYGGVEVLTLPTPGHTLGSVTYLIELGGRHVAFCGDLVHQHGLWSLSSTQWSYSGVEGLAATKLSCRLLADREPDLLLPAHGGEVDDPAALLDRVAAGVQELVDLRLGRHWDLDDWLRRPWQQLSPHLLWNRHSFAHSYALLSDSGAALLVDWGYDLSITAGSATGRADRRPLLASLEVLRRDFGVERIEAVVATHYHDDHVAGMPMLRDVEGTELWAPANVAPILADPCRYDVPCLWFDPIVVDRIVPLGEPVTWREYELAAHPLPGHTLYAAALEIEVDGRRVLATGDQQGPDGDGAEILNYQYRNRFRIDDFVASAALYRRLRPDVLLTGHWGPRAVDDGLLEQLERDGARLAALHRELLPLDEVDLGAEGFAARLAPYRSTVATGEGLQLEAEVLNPFAEAYPVAVRLIAPAGWTVEPAELTIEVAGHGRGVARFAVRPDRRARRARVAADVTVGDVAFGQQAEALVDVT